MAPRTEPDSIDWMGKRRRRARPRAALLRGWDLSLRVASEPGRAVFLRIADAISDDIRRGRLQEGDVLPGTRRLARMLGVSRITAQAAYDELRAQGLVATRQARDTYVCRPDVDSPARED